MQMRMQYARAPALPDPRLGLDAAVEVRDVASDSHKAAPGLAMAMGPEAKGP